MDSTRLAGAAPTGWGEAWFTSDRRYRWRLRRTWPPLLGQPDPGRLAVFVGLNPSDANHQRDDATLRRGVGYAHRDGCTGVEFVNLSPKVAHRPKVMLGDLAAGHPWTGPWWHEDNMATIVAACTGADTPGRPTPLVILGWGANATHKLLAPIADEVRDRLAYEGVTCWALGFSQKGEPLHPLFLPGNTPLVPVPTAVAW